MAWEGRFPAATGNPCLVEGRSGFLLYYSAAAVFLRDCLFIEPRYVGVAEGDAPEGPLRKRAQPILSPSRDDPYRNLGAGAIKVFRDGDGFVGLENGIYRDAAGASGSAILLLASTDGFAWTQVDPEPIIGPEGSGWKHAFVYQLDVARSGRSYASTTTPGAAGSSAPRGSAWRSRRRSPAARSRPAPAIGPHRVGRGYAQRVLVRDPTLDSKPS